MTVGSNWHDSLNLDEAEEIAYAVEFPIERLRRDLTGFTEPLAKEEFVKCLLDHIARITDEEKRESAANEYGELPGPAREWFEKALEAWNRSMGGELNI